MRIVLIGMSGSGKSTFGRFIASLMEVPFIDTDEEICKKYGDISAIFSSAGEKTFREFEEHEALLAAQNENCVIATGGGMVLNQNAMKALKKGGLVVYLYCDADFLFERLKNDSSRPLLLGEDKLHLLKSANVLVVGLGGVGAYAAEMIARAGVGRMTIADADVVSESNINRQLIALHSTIGREKSELMAERLRDINPDIELTVVNRFIKDDETDALLDSDKFDYIVDAIDTLSPKLALIKGALDRNIPLVSSMGAGAKTDPTKMDICDIAKTHHCPLAHMLRKRLHKIGIRTGFQAVFSPEPVREGAMILCEEQNKKSNTGTISYIPALFGIGCASVVIRGLIGEM